MAEERLDAIRQERLLLARHAHVPLADSARLTPRERRAYMEALVRALEEEHRAVERLPEGAVGTVRFR